MLVPAWLFLQLSAAPVETPPPAPTVQVCASVRSEGTDASGLRDAVEAQVADVDVPVDFDGTARVCERTVSFGLRLDEGGGHYELFIEDSRRPDERIVRTLGDLDMDGRARDEMFALVVRRALVAAVAGYAIEVEEARVEARADAEATAAETKEDEAEAQPLECQPCEEGPPPPPRTELRLRRNWFRLGTGYRGRTWASEQIWQHGLRLEAGWEHISGAELLVAGSLMQSQLVEDDAVHLRVNTQTVELLGGYRVSWDRASVAVQAGLAADTYTREAISRVTGLQIQTGSRRWIAGAHLGADGAIRLYGPLDLQLGVGAQWLPGSFDFTVEEGPISRTLLSLQAVRFDLRAGLRVQI